MTAPHPSRKKQKKNSHLKPSHIRNKNLPPPYNSNTQNTAACQEKKPWTGNKLGKRRCRSYFNPTFLILCLDRRKVFMLISNSAQWTKFVLIFSQGRSPIPFFMKVFLGPHVARQVPPTPFLLPVFFFKVRLSCAKSPLL